MKSGSSDATSDPSSGIASATVESVTLFRTTPTAPSSS